MSQVGSGAERQIPKPWSQKEKWRQRLQRELAVLAFATANLVGCAPPSTSTIDVSPPPVVTPFPTEGVPLPTEGVPTLAPDPTKPSPTPEPTEPTMTPTSEPTSTPEPTEPIATPMPTIEVADAQGNKISVPDPKISNPELFDLQSPDSPIVQFANAFGVTPDQVGELTPQVKTGADGKPFVVLTTADLPQTADFDESGTPLMIAQQGEDGDYGWSITYLKTLAEKLNIEIGTNETYFEGKGNAQQLVIENFNLLEGENSFSWNYIEPTQGKLSQSRINHIKEQIRLAEENHMDFIGSIFSWSHPDWIKNGNFSREELEQIVTDHVDKMLGLFPEINKWIVVNELHPKEYHEDFLRDKLGGAENYLKLVYSAARKIRPDLTLIYSDNGNETTDSPNYQRNQQYLDLLKRDGLIDAIAMHIHIDAKYPPAKESIINAMRSFASKGVKVYITELDVNLKNIKGTPGERYSLQAKIYADTVAAALEVGNQICPLIGTWNNYGDQYSWYEIPGAAPKDRSSPDADPTMFDDQGKPKKAYYETLKIMYQNLKE